LSNIVLSFYFFIIYFFYSFFVIQATSSAGYRGTGVQGCRAAGLQGDLSSLKWVGCWGASGRWGAKILLVIFLPFKNYKQSWKRLVSKTRDWCLKHNLLGQNHFCFRHKARPFRKSKQGGCGDDSTTFFAALLCFYLLILSIQAAQCILKKVKFII
jgi:hypothetical protein